MKMCRFYAFYTGIFCEINIYFTSSFGANERFDTVALADALAQVHETFEKQLKTEYFA